MSNHLAIFTVVKRSVGPYLLPTVKAQKKEIAGDVLLIDGSLELEASFAVAAGPW